SSDVSGDSLPLNSLVSFIVSTSMNLSFSIPGIIDNSTEDNNSDSQDNGIYKAYEMDCDNTVFLNNPYYNC
ncbi:unnamed protein product, partial [Heterobilharzia americana]